MASRTAKNVPGLGRRGRLRRRAANTYIDITNGDTSGHFGGLFGGIRAETVGLIVRDGAKLSMCCGLELRWCLEILGWGIVLAPLPDLRASALRP